MSEYAAVVQQGESLLQKISDSIIAFGAPQSALCLYALTANTFITPDYHESGMTLASNLIFLLTLQLLSSLFNEIGENTSAYVICTIGNLFCGGVIYYAHTIGDGSAIEILITMSSIVVITAVHTYLIVKGNGQLTLSVLGTSTSPQPQLINKQEHPEWLRQLPKKV